MALASDKIVEAARACVGVPFRPQGRAPDTGLDCVGVALHAYLPSAARATLRRDYRLRGEDPATLIAEIERLPFRRIGPRTGGASDLLICESGPDQLHLTILTGDGFIHADARLRRVVEVPGPPSWPVIAAFRFEGALGNEENSGWQP